MISQKWFLIGCISLLVITPLQGDIPEISGIKQTFYSENWSIQYPPDWKTDNETNHSKETEWIRIFPQDESVALDIGSAVTTKPISTLIDDIFLFVQTEGSTIIRNTSNLQIGGYPAITFDYQGPTAKPGVCRVYYIAYNDTMGIAFYHSNHQGALDAHSNETLDIITSFKPKN
jgi:hypothetical protein